MTNSDEMVKLAEKYGFWLDQMEPGVTYPYAHIRGHYRVPMFAAGLLEASETDPPEMRLTELGTALRSKDTPA